MPRLKLIHWKPGEAAEQITKLQKANFIVDSKAVQDQSVFKEIHKNPPDAFLIDLSRLPSHGRDVALGLRKNKSTRYVPMIFIGGDPAKVEKIKEHLPDAYYCSWNKIKSTIKTALSKTIKYPVVPGSNLAGYSGTPLPKKLGIKENYNVLLINEPKEFRKLLDELPEEVQLVLKAKNKHQLIIWFISSMHELLEGIEDIPRYLDNKGSIWICNPKKTSGVKTDFNQNDVRRVGLANGLVDYKVCAIDETWTGLKFTFRK